MITKLEAAIKEYETLHAFCLEIYKSYIKILTFVVIFIGAAVAIIFKEYEKFVSLISTSKNLENTFFGLPEGGLFVIIVLIIFVLTINTWFAGWAYIHSELWSYRFYLAKVEMYIKRELMVEESDSSFSIYSSGLFNMYNAKTTLRLSASYILSMSFCSVALAIYVSSLFMVLYINNYNFISIVAVSLSCFVSTITAISFKSIVRVQHESLEKHGCSIRYFKELQLVNPFRIKG